MEARKTVLYEKHVQLTGGKNMAEFAGYRMPLWYSSITDEHNAVRTAAGQFDCTHMGVINISGSNAAKFINLITANNVDKISEGSAQYSFLLQPNGKLIDDLIVYKLNEDDFILVVNAANDQNVQAYLSAVPEEVTAKCGQLPNITDLRSEQAAQDRLVVIPLQGPASTDLIASMISNEISREQFLTLGSFKFIKTKIDQIDVIICRTGYTGSKVGYEFLVHPEKAPQLWDAILKKGEPKGIKPCGLGARDSLRIEAGLPLFGHELAGPHDISPFEAGYGWAVDLEKDYFTGYQTLKQKHDNRTKKILRLEIDGSKGIRPVRDKDAVLDSNGNCIGTILSSVKIADKQIALAYTLDGIVKTDDFIGIYYVARNERHIKQGKAAQAQEGENYPVEVKGKVLKRFAKF